MTSTLSASVERELERRAKHKLAVLRHVDEVSGSVAATCRYYGITRTCYYKWRKRYEDDGFEGLKDRSSAPHRSPNATNAEVIAMSLHASNLADVDDGGNPINTFTGEGSTTDTVAQTHDMVERITSRDARTTTAPQALPARGLAQACPSRSFDSIKPDGTAP